MKTSTHFIIFIILLFCFCASIGVITLKLYDSLKVRSCQHKTLNYIDYNTYIAKYVYKCNDCGDSVKLTLKEVLGK